MTEKEWDEKLKKKFFGKEIYAKFVLTEEIVCLLDIDRKHQKSEMLKRLPDVKDKQKYSINYVDGWNDCLAKVKDKLKEKNG